MLKAITQELVAERNITNLNEQYQRFLAQFQDNLAAAHAKRAKLEKETLKSLQLDPATHTIGLDADGNLKVSDVQPVTEKK